MPNVNAVSTKAKTLEPAPLLPKTWGLLDSYALTAANTVLSQLTLFEPREGIASCT